MIARVWFALWACVLTILAFFYWHAVWHQRSVSLAGFEWFAWTSHTIACSEQAACSAADHIAIAPQVPLSAIPFLSVLQRELEDGKSGSLVVANQLFVRNPRSVTARMVLANHALSQADYAEFGYYYFPIFTILRHDQRRFADLLVSLSSDPEVFSLIEKRLGEGPSWGREYLLSSLDESSIPFNALAPLFDNYPDLFGHFLSRMVEHGQTRNAYAHFVSSLSQQDMLQLGVPFNSDFRRSDAPVPFNWGIVSKSAEYLNSGGVLVHYRGYTEEQLLRQTVPIAPGRYRFSISFERVGSEDDLSGRLEWRLSCAQSSLTILTMQITGSVNSEFKYFEIPSKQCEFQNLSLHGIPGLLKEPTVVTLREVSIIGNEETPKPDKK